MHGEGVHTGLTSLIASNSQEITERTTGDFDPYWVLRRPSVGTKSSY